MRFSLAILYVFLACQVCHADLLVNQYDPNLHDRFENSSQFIGNPYDWSGVGKRVNATTNVNRWTTMISDSFGLSVGHAAQPVGATVRFYHTNDPNGPFEDRVVASTTSFLSNGIDLSLTRFTAPVSQSVQKYSLLDVSPADVAGLELNVFGLTGGNFPPETQVRLGTNTVDQFVSAGTINGINYDSIIWDFDVSEGQGEARVDGGDSGAPSFVIVNGAPALLGLHEFNATLTNGTEISADIFLPSYFDLIEDEVTAFGESLTFTTVPEPSSFVICFSALGLILVRRRRIA